MKFSYCPVCGERLSPKNIGDEGETPYCGRCKRPFFPFSYPCVICLCVDGDGNVVLIKQSYEPDRYVCVAGYIKAGESAEDAVCREIAEETGLRADKIRFLYSRYYEKHDNLMLAFAARVSGDSFSLSDEVAEAERFSPDEAEKRLPKDSYGLEMLRILRENDFAI